jgi:hypothetical protein
MNPAKERPHWHRWKDNIEIIPKAMGWEGILLNPYE